MTAGKAAAVRRGQRVIRMVSELHRLGFQKLRFQPVFSRQSWRIELDSSDRFSPSNGAWMMQGASPLTVRYSSADADGYFDWPDVRTATARQLADRFIVRFPKICTLTRGRDWAYAGWTNELLGVLERDSALPFIAAPFCDTAPGKLDHLPLQRTCGRHSVFELPPPGALPTPETRNRIAWNSRSGFLR